SQRNPCKNDQGERNETFFDEPPDLGELVGTTKSFHPRNHHAGSQPQSKQRGSKDQSEGPSRAPAQVSLHSAGTCRYDLRQRVRNLVRHRLGVSPGGKHGTEDQQGGEKRKNR